MRKILRLALCALGCAAAVLLAGCGGGSGSQSPNDALKADVPSVVNFQGNGTWWNPAQSGTGFVFDAQAGTGVVTFFVFESNGKPAWYSAVGPFSANGDGSYGFQGTLQRFTGGQPASSATPKTPSATNIGLVSIVFQGDTAQVALPNRSFPAQKFHPSGGARKAGIQPEPGVYWNPDESGRGYTVDVFGDTLSVGVFHYDESGAPTWHLVVGNLHQGTATGPLQRFSGGQTLDGPYVAPTGSVSDGTVMASFYRACAANLWLPGVLEMKIRRFAFGTLPAGLECKAESGAYARTAAEGPLFGSQLQELAGTKGLFTDPAAVAIDTAGVIYVADSGTHTIRKVAPNGTVTLLAGAAGFAGHADGQGAAARFSQPRGIAVAADGTVYVGDYGNSVIRKITPDGMVSTFAGAAGQRGFGDAAQGLARFVGPGALKLDQQGNLYVVDTPLIRKVTPAGQVTTVIGNLEGAPRRVLGAAGQSRFYVIQGFAVDALGNFLVTEIDAAMQGWVRKFDAAGNMVAIPNTADGSLPFAFPTDVAIDENGNAYILSMGAWQQDQITTEAVFKLTPSGVLTQYGGKILPSYSHLVPAGVGPYMGGPFGIALDPSVAAGGRALIADLTGIVWELKH